MYVVETHYDFKGKRSICVTRQKTKRNLQIQSKCIRWQFYETNIEYGKPNDTLSQQTQFRYSIDFIYSPLLEVSETWKIRVLLHFVSDSFKFGNAAVVADLAHISGKLMPNVYNTRNVDTFGAFCCLKYTGNDKIVFFKWMINVSDVNRLSNPKKNNLFLGLL